MKIYETPWLRPTSQRFSAYNSASCIVSATFSASADDNNSFNYRTCYSAENATTDRSMMNQFSLGFLQLC